MTTRTAERSLDQSLVSGIAWTGIVKWGSQVLSWAATLGTVRLLAPTDYGLFGMAMVYIGFGQIVTEAGISAAVVQRPALTDREAAELAGLSVLVGVLFALLTLGAAPLIALFFGQPPVRGILSLLSAVFLIRSVQIVPRALLARELRFRRIAALEVVESLALVTTTLALALFGWGYWSLAVGCLVGYSTSTILAVLYRWVTPALPTALIAVPVRFTWQVTVSQVSWYAYTNADFAVVGKMLGSVALGAYTFAWNIANIAGERVSALVGRVTPPLFAAVQGDPPALRRYLALVVEGIALLTLPASVGLSLVADEFVRVVAGDRWAAAVVPLRILAVYAAFRSIFYLAPQVLIATGRARSSMRFGLLATVILPPAFLIGSHWGTAGVATAWVIVYPVLALLTYMRETLRAAQLSWRAYWASLWPACRATLLMAVAVYAVQQATPATMSTHAALLLHVLVGAATYSALVIFGLRTRLRPLVGMLRESVRRQPLSLEPVLTVGTPAAADRILLISYHFAPSSSVGALRWQKLVALAAERGWQFDVIALAPAELKAADMARYRELPPGTRVYGVATRPLQLMRITRRLSQMARTLRLRHATANGRLGSLPSGTRTWLPRTPRDVLRAYFAWLDVRHEARWASDAARLAITIHERGVHRAVVTCGPPHQPHLAGVTVSQATGLPLVLDLRDPWSLVERLPEAIASRVWLSLAARGERRAINAASLVVTNTGPLRTAMARLYPEHERRMLAVMNGCDEEPVTESGTADTFIVGYAGSIYLDRDPRPLLRAAARVARELQLTPREFSVEFMGDVAAYDGEAVRDIAKAEGVASHLVLHPARPRAEALAFVARSAMLVLLPQDSHLAIPAKLFDYMRCDAWLLAMADAGSATAQLLRGTGADVVAPDDVDGIAAVIRQRYADFRAGWRGAALAADARFSRRAQAERLFSAIEAVAGAPRARETAEALCAVS